MDGVLDRQRLRELFDLGGDAYQSRGGAFTEDPYPTFQRLRKTGPVHEGAPHEALGWTGDVFFQGLPYPDRPHFSAYDFDTVSTILKDDRHFVTRVDPLPDEPALPNAAILFMNGKEHRDYRTLVQPSFIPAKAAWWLDKWIKQTVEQLIDTFAQESRVDLNLDFCAPIPLLTITQSLGITIEESLEVRAVVTSDGQGMATLFSILAPLIAARRAEPRDDLISVLVKAELADEEGTRHRLDDADVMGFAFLLLAAGSGTTWKQMGITLVGLLQHPEALSKAREDRSFLREVIEESVRWSPTDPAFARFVASPCSLGGRDIPAGAIVHACLAAANRDPSRWERADEFDPFRSPKPHIGFGHGPHTCLGMHVARAEMTHGIGALLDRFPHLRLDPDEPRPRIVGLYERGPDKIPVRLNP